MNGAYFYSNKEKTMFGSKSLVSKKNDKSMSHWFSGLTPWNSSLTPFSSLRDEILDVFDNFNFGMSPAVSEQFIPRIEIKDQENSYLIAAEVPGMSDKDMTVTIRDNNLILEGEKKLEHKEEKKGMYRSEFSYGSFYRAIPLTDEVDPEKVSASYRNGILKVTVEKRPEAQRKSKKVPIVTDKSSEEKSDTKH
jgi:HSP20 family protein